MKCHCCTFISFQTTATIDMSLSRSHSVIHTAKHTPAKLWFLAAHLAISSRSNYCSAVFFFQLHTCFLHWIPYFSPDYLNSQLLSYYLMLPVPVPFHLWMWMQPSKQFLMDEIKELLLRTGNGRGEGSKKEVSPWALGFAATTAFLAIPSQLARTCQSSLPIITSSLNFCWNVLVCWFPISRFLGFIRSSCSTCPNSFISPPPLLFSNHSPKCSGLETLHRTYKQCLLNRSSISSKLPRFSSGKAQFSSWPFSSVTYLLDLFLNPSLCLNSWHWRRGLFPSCTFVKSHKSAWGDIFCFLRGQKMILLEYVQFCF